MGKRSLWAAGQTFAFVQLEARLTLGAEVPAETVLTLRRATLWEEGDIQVTHPTSEQFIYSLFLTLIFTLEGEMQAGGMERKVGAAEVQTAA